jgi:MFS superfamily sulfate permease-like transporter
MLLENILIYFSAISFIFYSINSLYSKRLISEFDRWGYGKFRILIASFQLLAGIGFIIGLYFSFLISIVSFLLSVMMLVAIFVRIKVKDDVIEIFPAIFYASLNLIIFYNSIY